MANLADHRVYSCNNCWNPIAFKDDILSKSFIVSCFQPLEFSYFILKVEEFDHKGLSLLLERIMYI